MTGLPLVWGATGAEVARAYPADTAVGPDPLLMTRAVDVHAPVELVWRWLCQVAVAPYSYDWIDNRGRRSPRELTPGADRLVLGQTMAMVFELVSFDAPHQWTAVTTARGERMFGPVAMTYAAEPGRIVCRIAAARRGRVDRVRGRLLAWGDLVMMRKQLHTLRDLAEHDAAA
ncbi:MAG TPA: hypothetical protein VD864_02175 [Nocardioides sp.]|nr:hypothetical protein [Nocardioides sp.]